MHRLNIFLSYHGHSGWVGLFFWPLSPSNPNPGTILQHLWYASPSHC
ncbi:hypothetical protein ID866_9430 [Astraeus odoratus]|nr:hypothetical protein ID866_9430 [Astraeus odoratus]